MNDSQTVGVEYAGAHTMAVHAMPVVICWFLLALTVGVEDAGPVRALTRGWMDIGWSRWSPDGSVVGFWALASNDLGIRVVNRDGSGLRLLTDPTAGTRPGLFGWGPHGSSIVYGDLMGQGLVLRDLDSGAVRRLKGTPSLSGSPAWSPDGKTIALASSEKQFEGIFLIAVDGTKVRRLPSPAGKLWSPTWSRDGSSILVCAQGEAGAHMWRTEADGSGLKKLLRLEGNTGIHTAWSPDGAWIVYARPSLDGPSGLGGSSLYAASADGRRSLHVTGGGSVGDEYPSWSPNGREIAFVRRPLSWHTPQPPRMSVIDVSELFPDVVEAARRQAERGGVRRR